MVMVVGGAQVDAVLNGRDGLLSTMTAGTVMVCSTIALSELLPIAERARGPRRDHDRLPGQRRRERRERGHAHAALRRRRLLTSRPSGRS